MSPAAPFVQPSPPPAWPDLSEGEGEGLRAGIEELDLERPVAIAPGWRISW